MKYQADYLPSKLDEQSITSYGEGPSGERYAYPTSSYGRHNIDIGSLAESSTGSMSKLTFREDDYHNHY